MARHLDQGAGRDRERQGHDRRVMSDDRNDQEETEATRRQGRRRVVLRASRLIEITTGPDRETR